MSYYELPDNDRPSEDIWLDNEALAGHFENVRARYRTNAGGGEWQSVEDAPMQENHDDMIRRIKNG